MDQIVWPNGKRICVLMSFDVDADFMWLQRGDGNRDHITNLSKGAYGPKEGLPRIIRMLDRHDIKGTFYVPGWVAEHYEKEIRLIVEEGHEIAYHGYEHEYEGPLSYMQMVALMEKSEEIMRRQYGVKLYGHRSADACYNDYSIRLFHERGYLYCSDERDRDVPYFHQLNGKDIPLVEFPKESLYDDSTFYFVTDSPTVRDGIRPPSYALEVWRSDFDAMAERGGHCISYIFHPQFSGHPGRVQALGELIEYEKAHGAWFATGKEAAEYLIAQHGPFAPQG